MTICKKKKIDTWVPSLSIGFVKVQLGMFWKGIGLLKWIEWKLQKGTCQSDKK